MGKCNRGRLRRCTPWLLLAIVSALVAPVVLSGHIRRAYILTVQRHVAGVLPPRFVLVGDSLAAGAPWGLSVVNLAQGGASIAQASYQAAQASAYGSMNLVIAVGINDVVRYHHAPGRIAQDFSFLLAEAGTMARIIVTLIPFTSNLQDHDAIGAANAVLRDLAVRHGAIVLDLNPILSDGRIRQARFTTDGIHFSNAAYELWWTALEAVLAPR